LRSEESEIEVSDSAAEAMRGLGRREKQRVWATAGRAAF
jgi:hypothetical protein